MPRPLLVALALLLVAIPVGAGAATGAAPTAGTGAEGPPSPLIELARDDVSPPRRAALVRAICEAPTSPPPGALAPLLSPGSPRPAQIDAARIAACRRDPILIPLMYASFHRGKAASLAEDPDLYERLLHALQRFPIPVLREALTDPDRGLGGVVHGELADLAWRRLHRDWLQPLGGDAAPALPAPGVAERVLPEAARWLDDVLNLGEEGLVRLQTDSGDHGYLFLQRLQGWHLAALIASGSASEARLAVEVCRQSGMCDAAARDALAERQRRAPDASLGTPEELPDTRDDPREIGAPLRPYVVPAVEPATAEALVEPPRRVPRGALALLVLVAGWGAWVAALRLRPGWRTRLFPAGGVMLAGTLLCATEAALALAGVEPLAWTSDGGWSDPLALRGVEGSGYLLEPAVLSGEPWLRVANDGARWDALPDVPASSRTSWRIVTLGESSVHASNHLAHESFAQVLGRRLRARNPGQPVEVLNGGVGGAISDNIVDGARDALDAGADLLVLYHGINDLGRFEILAGMRAFSPLQLGVRILLDESRLARVLHDLLPARPAPRADEGAWQDGEPPSDEVAARLQRLAALRCSRNQQRVVRAAHARGVPVIVVAQALVTDPSYPDEPDKRRMLRWIAEETAARTGAPLLDGHRVLGAHSLAHGGGEDPGAAYFWDQLHPSQLGHAVLGEALAPTAERLLRSRQGVTDR